MSTLKGFQANEIKPQPGFEPAQNENGGWEGTHTFSIRRQDFENTAIRNRFRGGTRVTDLDPDVSTYFSFMTLSSCRVRHGEGDILWIICSFAGAESAQFGNDEDLAPSAQPTYELVGQLQEAPLSEHPKWTPLTNEQKTALGHLMNGVLVFDMESGKICQINPSAATQEEFFDPFLPYDEIVTGDCLEFAKRIASGVKTYLRPTMTWRERTEGSVQLTPEQLNKLGNIATPRGGPPEPNGGRDWMLTSTYQSRTGSKYVADLEWTMSERGGHDDFLYDD